MIGTMVGSASSRPLTFLARRVRFDRNELAGAFGDIGTDLPLIVGMILASGMDVASVLVVFGVLQILTALTYGIPMPVQPLKAVAALVIALNIRSDLIYGAGFAIGVVVLLLTLTGLIDWLAKVIPKAVIRGIQFGLGLQLSYLALTKYVQSEGVAGYALAAVSFTVIIALFKNKRFPPALLVIACGIVYAFLFKVDTSALESSLGFSIPQMRVPTIDDIVQGFLLLSLPQIPLSLGNSLLATRQIAQDYFPEKAPSLRKIAMTYSLLNIFSPLFSGIPVCHGSGGMAGHYFFGARTGGSVVLYGLLYLGLGLFLSNGFSLTIQVFPLPMLGVILLFEGLALMQLMKDTVASPSDLRIALLVGLLAVGVPYGYLVGMIVGVVLSLVFRRRLAEPQQGGTT
jgi:Molybdate transporter of MFS superfamily